MSVFVLSQISNGIFEFHADDNLRIVCNGFQDTNLYRKYDVVEMTIMMMGPGTFTMQDWDDIVSELKKFWTWKIE